MSIFSRWGWLLPLVLAGSVLPAAEQGDRALLTVARIFDSEEFDGEPFSAAWLEDGSGYVTLDPSESVRGGKDVVRHDPQTGQGEILVPAACLVPPGEGAPLRIEGYTFSNDMSLLLIYTNSKRVWRHNTRGDYWVLDRASRELWRLGGDAAPSTLMFAKFSPTGRQAAYVRGNDIYVEDLLTRQIAPLTTSGSGEIVNGTFDWVYEEELGLRDGFRWSPDGTSIAYWQLDTRGVQEFPLLNRTDSLYPKRTDIKYPKVGQRNSACRVGVASVEGLFRDEPFMDAAPRGPASSDGAATGPKCPPTRWLDVPGDPREHYLARMGWTPGPPQIWLEQLNRRQNVNRVMLADAGGGPPRTVLIERDDAWIDVDDELRWLDGGKRFTWLSERDGWRHVYLASRSGDQVKLLTPGEYDVIEPLHVDEKGGWLYFLASPDNPTQQFLYRVGLDGSPPERLTPAGQGGSHDYQISPCGRFAIHRFSSFGVPPQVELVTLPEHKRVRTLVSNAKLRQRLAALRTGQREMFRVGIGDGVELDAWCLKPPEFDPERKYPLLVYVYGEPAGRTVVDGWGGKNYLWHLMLAQRGYLVMSFDNRGTRVPRGRAWRKAVFRQIGILAPADQAKALEAVLAERSYVDPQRVGIWGWSGGGSMSLNAIFKYPDLYQVAMAVAPVANQRYYDTIYQERYMGLPGDNVDGYLKGSPINFAHRLKGDLLIVHGTGDDNCHYQATEALINELVRCNKPFSMMAYPNRTHAIREGPNTTRHLRELLTRYLLAHLPLGPEAGKEL